MKRSISEIGPEDSSTENKKTKLAAENVDNVIGFAHLPQDNLIAILELFDDTKDVTALSLTCSQLQNRCRPFWESTVSSLVPLRAQPYRLHEKQFISQKVIDMKKKHQGTLPFKLIDFSDLDPTRSLMGKKTDEAEDDSDESGQFSPSEARFLSWDSTRFVILTYHRLSVFSIHDPKPIYHQQFKATAFSKIDMCSKTHSIGALVRLDEGAGAQVFILHDDNGQISLVHAIKLERKKRSKKKKKLQKVTGGRGKPMARSVDEDDADDEENEESNGGDEEGDEEDDEEEDYEVPKFRQTGYQNFVLGDEYMTVSQRLCIKQFSTSTGKLLRIETFSESEVNEQVHAAVPVQYLEFGSVALSPDGAKAYAWSTQHYFDGGPLYELDIATGSYRILFNPESDYDKYPDIEFLNDGKYFKIESLGTNASSWYVHKNEPPYRQIGSFSEEMCGGSLTVSHDVSKGVFYGYGSDVKVVEFSTDPDDEGEVEDGVTVLALGEEADWTFKWHPADSSIFFASSGDKVIINNTKRHYEVTLDQPFSNSFWFLQDVAYYEKENVSNKTVKSPHVLFVFMDSELHPIVWDLSVDLNNVMVHDGTAMLGMIEQ